MNETKTAQAGARTQQDWVCENHPNKAWPEECECGAGVPRNAITPTPWTLCYDGEIDGANGECVCLFKWDSFKEFNDSATNKANARLIAAAPELLEACKAAEKALTDNGRWLPDEYQQAALAARAAIALAEGRAE